MYKRTKKIPTIIGLLILLIGLGGAIYLNENRTSAPVKAADTTQPNSILITNLTDTSFTVTWLTKEPTVGSVTYAAKRDNTVQLALDDRDIDNKPKPYLTHHVTIRNLSPITNYEFTIISGEKKYLDNNKPYSITTAPKLETQSNLEPAYGQVSTVQNQPAEGALVFINLPQGLPLSTLVKPSGNWLIPLNMARTAELKSFSSENVTVESINIYASIDDKAQAVTDTNNDSPVPPITIGKSYNFQGLQGNKVSEQTIASQNQESDVLGKQNANKIDVYSPEEGANFVSTRPLIRGKGIPNKEVTIEIESTQKIVGKTTVSTDGSWSWTPPKDLSPDKHKVTITTTDENGKKVTIERNFLVFKSGTQVLGEATPSGTLTATPSPHLSPSPTISNQATPSATLKPLLSTSPTPSKIPVTGNVSNTVILIGIGIIFVIAGFAKLLFSV